MKKMSLLMSVLSIVLLYTSCAKEDALKGSGNIISENRELPRFTKINNATSVNIIISQGLAQQIEVSADDNVISIIQTTVENGALKIDLTKSNYVDVSITVSITIPKLEALKNTGSGNMTVSGLAISSIDNEGSGGITISGTGEYLTLKNSGSGSYQGYEFITEECSVINSGSGNCEINCTVSLSGSNSGSGSIFYKGTPNLDISNTGSGELVDSN